VQLITYKFELRPNKSQERQFVVFAGQVRFVWNQLLSLARERHKRGESQDLSPFGFVYEVTKLKLQYDWLGESSRQCIDFAAKNLTKAFRRFFAYRKSRGGRRYGHPVFKSRRRGRDAFQFSEQVKVSGNKVRLPKIGWVRFRKSREVVGEIREAAVKRSASGKWFVSIVCKCEIQPLPPVKQICGVDVGFSIYATIADQTHYEEVTNPRWFKASHRKLKRLQQSLSRKKKGSNNRAKAKLLVARQHERVVNQRRDFQHKLSTKLVVENQAIGVESLSLVGLMRAKLSKSFADAGFGAFFGMLKYKCLWYGRTLVEAERFYPSSKTCSQCGHVKESLELSERVWVCVCGKRLPRDLNAALNLRNLAVGYTESLNACGVGVSLDSV